LFAFLQKSGTGLFWYDDGQFKDDGGKIINNILPDGMPSFIDSPFSHNHQRHGEGQI